MSTSNGEKATANNFNQSYISREQDSNTVGKIDLDNPDTGSVADVQKELNGQASFVGGTTNGAANRLPTWNSDTIGSANDPVKVRVEAVQTQVETNTGQIPLNTAELIALRSTTGTTNGDTDMSSYSAGPNGFSITNDEPTKTNIQELVNGVDSRVPESTRNASNGFAGLDANARILPAQLPTSATEYKGAWDANTNTPTLVDGTGTNGDLYRASVAGSQDLGSGSESYGVGDAVIYNGTVWEKIPADDAVNSVNGQSGIVALTTTDIPEGTNEYYTNAKADARIAAASIDDLSDVDTTTVAPTQGQTLVYDSVEAEWVPGNATGSGSGAGSKTYFANGDFENNIDDASVYDDGGSYVDGDGGAPSALSIVGTSSALAGDQSLEITKAASDATGEGVTLTTQTIDEIDLGKELLFSFAVDASNANYTEDNILLKAYDVTNSAELAVVPINNLSESGGLLQALTSVSGKVLTSPTTAEVRLSLHTETDSSTGSSWVIRVDEARIGPSAQLPAAVVTEWQSYDLQITAQTSNPSKASSPTLDSAIYRRVGDSIEIQYMYRQDNNTGASAGSGTYQFSLPPGFTINTSKLQVTNSGGVSAVGSASVFAGSFFSGTANVQNDGSAIILVVGNDTNLDQVVNNVRANLGLTSVYYSFVATVPVNELSAGNLLSTNETAFSSAVARLGGDPANALANQPIIVPTTIFDNFNAYNNTTGLYTAPRTATYMIHGSLASAGIAGIGIQAFVNSTNNGAFGFTDSNAEATFTGLVQANAGDTISIRPSSALDCQAINLNIQALPDFTTFGTYGTFEVLSSKSATANPGATNIYPTMTGNSLPLPVGTFRLFGNAFFSSSPTANYTFITCGFYAANGANTGTIPASITTIPGLTLLSAPQINLGSENGIAVNSVNQTSFDLTPIIVRLSQPATIFVVPFAVAGSGANIAETVTINAERLQ